MKLKLLGMLAVLSLALPLASSAAPTPTTVQQTTDRDSGAPINTNTPRWGQVITVPAGASKLTGLSFDIGGDVKFVVYDWSGSAFGAQLYQSPAYNLSGYPRVMTKHELASGGLDVSGKTQIFVGLEGAAPTNEGGLSLHSSNVAPGFLAYVLQGSTTISNGDMYFIANFDEAPPAPVPTLTEWSFVALGLTLVGGAVVMARRRRLTV